MTTLTKNTGTANTGTTNAGSSAGAMSTGQLLQNRYRVLDRLGKGGMGSVYIAEDLRLSGKRVAVKELAPNATSPRAVTLSRPTRPANCSTSQT